MRSIILFLSFILTTHNAHSQIYKSKKINSRYNYDYIQLQSTVKNYIKANLDIPFIKKHFSVNDSLNFDFLVVFNEKGDLLNNETVVYTESEVFNNKIISIFDKFPQLSPNKFRFSEKEYEYQVLVKAEFVVAENYELIGINRIEIGSFNIYVDPNDKHIAEYADNFDYHKWEKIRIKIPMHFTLNENYTISKIKVFSYSDYLNSKVLEFVKNVDNCFFYIALETQKNYSANILLVLDEELNPTDSFSSIHNLGKLDYYYSKSIDESFPVFTFCKDNNLFDKNGVCFFYSVEEYICNNINQDILADLLKNTVLKARIKFTIDSNGDMMNVKVSQTKSKLKQEIFKVLNNFPRIEPGRNLKSELPVSIDFDFLMVF